MKKWIFNHLKKKNIKYEILESSSEKFKSPKQGANSSNAAGHKKGQEQPARFALVEVEVKDIVTEKTLCVLNRVPTTTTTRLEIAPRFEIKEENLIFFSEN